MLYNTEGKKETMMFPVQRGSNVTESEEKVKVFPTKTDLMRIIRRRVCDRVSPCKDTQYDNEGER